MPTCQTRCQLSIGDGNRRPNRWRWITTVSRSTRCESCLPAVGQQSSSTATRLLQLADRPIGAVGRWTRLSQLRRRPASQVVTVDLGLSSRSVIAPPSELAGAVGTRLRKWHPTKIKKTHCTTDNSVRPRVRVNKTCELQTSDIWKYLEYYYLNG